MNQQNLINSKNANLVIQITPEQLETFAKEIITNYMESVPDPTPNQMYTGEEVEELLKINRISRWRWEKKGYLKPVRIGQSLRYNKKDIDKLIGK